MSENCNHDCSSCGEDCPSRNGQKPDFSVPANAKSHVKKVIGVVSGKGGVGKSLVTSLMSVIMRRRGHSVAILDADVTGPSIPKAFGVHGELYSNEDEVAFLFVEQFDNLYGMLVDRTDVKRIRKSADDGEDGLFKVVASVFGDKLDDVFVGAANGAMDYIAYVDETWTPEDDEDRKRTLETEAFHLESLKAVLEIAEKNGLSVVGQIRDILAKGEEHLRHLKER